jgi:hypothetical protein
MKLKGSSTQSIIVGSIIAGIIAAAGLAYMWDSAEKSRINVAVQTVKEQMLFLESQRDTSFSLLEKWHSTGDGDEDYLDEIVSNDGLSIVNISKIFKDPNATWEIRQVNDQTFNKTFYIHIESNIDDDYIFWSKVLKKLGMLTSKYQIDYTP